MARIPSFVIHPIALKVSLVVLSGTLKFLHEIFVVFFLSMALQIICAAKIQYYNCRMVS